MERIQKRELWIDILKAILIILVVYGHADGLLNNYIYQFHVGAFFITSGLVFNIEKDGIFATIYKKFTRVLLPLLSFFFFFLLIQFIFINIDSDSYYLWTNNQFLGIGNTIYKFFINGYNNILILSAGWFLITLFASSILVKILYVISYKKDYILFILSSIIYIFGYWFLMRFGGITFSIFKIIYITFGQFYLVIGYLFKKYINRVFKNLYINLVVFILTFVGLFIFDKFYHSIDLADNILGNPFIDFIMIMNGFIMCMSVSKILEELPLVNKISIIGKNSLAIMLLHFMFFKIGCFILANLGLIDYIFIADLVPKFDIHILRFFIFIFSLISSFIVSILLKKIPVVRTVFLGVFKDDKKVIEYLNEISI